MTDRVNQFTLVDSLAFLYTEKYPTKFIRTSNPHKQMDPIKITVIDPELLVYNSDHFYFDRYTGTRITGDFKYGNHTRGSLFTILHGLIYDIHFGTIFGLPGRLLVCFASLVASSLPLTGFLVWWNGRKRN